MSTPHDYLLLRLEAPLMSCGGPMVDAIGPTRSFPGQAQITGLLGNALGYTHGDADALEDLQSRLRLASMLVRAGERICDYQTVDLGRPHLVNTAWTTRGRVEKRTSGSKEGISIRYRWYLSDALILVALTMAESVVVPRLSDLAAALDHPARPLFIGRSTCLPTAPLKLGPIFSAATPETALREGLKRLQEESKKVPRRRPVHDQAPIVEIDSRLITSAPANAESDRLVDRRDWRTQMHTGMRQVHRMSFITMETTP